LKGYQWETPAYRAAADAACAGIEDHSAADAERVLMQDEAGVVTPLA